MTYLMRFLNRLPLLALGALLGWLMCEHIKYRHGSVYDGRIETEKIFPEVGGVELIADNEAVARFDSIDALAHACKDALLKQSPDLFTPPHKPPTP